MSSASAEQQVIAGQYYCGPAGLAGALQGIAETCQRRSARIRTLSGVINIDWSMYLRIKRNPWLRRIAALVLSPERRRRFFALPDNVQVHDALVFLRENLRVLKPGGILRVVVPDLHRLVQDYLASYRASVSGADSSRHDDAVAAIIEQCVRREAFGSSQQAPWRRRLENLLLGDARARGETHQWMYDEINLGNMLRAAGFASVRRVPPIGPGRCT